MKRAVAGSPPAYVDDDVAYLLGMLFARGELRDRGSARRLIVTWDIRRLQPKLPPETPLVMDLDVENLRAVNNLRPRINELLEAEIDILSPRPGKIHLMVTFRNRTVGWRNLVALCGTSTNRYDFRIPEIIFNASRSIREEFLKGFADVAVTPSFADNAFGSRARIAFPVVHDNRPLGQELCRLFDSLGIEAKLLPGTPAKRGSKKEHRIRPFPEEFLPVGFSFPHKQALLETLVEYNRGLDR